MTKREICERMTKIYNSAMLAARHSGDIGGGPCFNVGKAIRDLLIDITVKRAEDK